MASCERDDRCNAVMRSKALSMKQATNDDVRPSARVQSAKAEPFVQRTFHLGKPLIDLTKANALAAELEDLERIARMGLNAGEASHP
jgi:hypothetical protein